MTASSPTDLSIKNNKNDEIRIIETTVDGNFLALRSNYDRLTHTQHNWRPRFLVLQREDQLRISKNLSISESFTTVKVV